MAGRNYQKRRTKERKDRQRAERREQSAARLARAQFGWREENKYRPDFSHGAALAAAAAILGPRLIRPQ